MVQGHFLVTGTASEQSLSTCLEFWSLVLTLIVSVLVAFLKQNSVMWDNYIEMMHSEA